MKRPGDVLLQRDYSLMSYAVYAHNLIKFGEPGFTHTAIIGDKCGKDILLYEGIVGVGFRKREIDLKRLQEEDIKYKTAYAHPKAELKDVLDTCESYAGRPYAHNDVLRITTNLFWSVNWDFDKNDLGLTCAKGIARILFKSSDKEIDFEKEFGMSHRLITPEHIRRSKQLDWYKYSHLHIIK